MPLGVPSYALFPESLDKYVLGVIIFVFSVWGAEINGGGTGEDCNCEGDDIYGIYWCWGWVSETWGVYVTGFMMGVYVGGGSKISSEIGWENIGWEKDEMGWEVGGDGVGKILSEIIE